MLCRTEESCFHFPALEFSTNRAAEGVIVEALGLRLLGGVSAAVLS